MLVFVMTERLKALSKPAAAGGELSSWLEADPLPWLLLLLLLPKMPVFCGLVPVVPPSTTLTLAANFEGVDLCLLKF